MSTEHVDDLMWKKNHVLSSAVERFAAKLAPKYILCTVQRVVSPLTYQLTNVNRHLAGKRS